MKHPTNCAACNVEVLPAEIKHYVSWYMLTNKRWKEIFGKERGFLCFWCMKDKFFRRYRRDPEGKDFTDCVLNLVLNPIVATLKVDQYGSISAAIEAGFPKEGKHAMRRRYYKKLFSKTLGKKLDHLALSKTMWI